MGRVAGSPYPVYVGGILYRSIFAASVESGISTVWIQKRLNASGGEPVFIRGTAVVEKEWVRKTLSVINSRQAGAAQ